MRQPVFELVRQGNTLTCPHCFDQNNYMYTHMCYYLEILDTCLSSIDEANNVDADQTAQVCRLICVFVVRILQNRFSYDMAYMFPGFAKIIMELYSKK